MVGNMQQTSSDIVFITTYKIIFRLDSHIRSGNRNIFIFGNIHPSRIVLFIIHPGSNRERRYIPLTMIEHGIYIGWKHRMVMVIHHHGRIGPPQECLGKCCTIIDLHIDFNIGLARIERKTLHPFGTEHALHFITPDRFTAVGILLDRKVGRQKSRGAVMLRPVELDSS